MQGAGQHLVCQVTSLATSLGATCHARPHLQHGVSPVGGRAPGKRCSTACIACAGVLYATEKSMARRAILCNTRVPSSHVVGRPCLDTVHSRAHSQPTAAEPNLGRDPDSRAKAARAGGGRVRPDVVQRQRRIPPPAGDAEVDGGAEQVSLQETPKRPARSSEVTLGKRHGVHQGCQRRQSQASRGCPNALPTGRSCGGLPSGMTELCRHRPQSQQLVSTLRPDRHRPRARSQQSRPSTCSPTAGDGASGREGWGAGSGAGQGRGRTGSTASM